MVTITNAIPKQSDKGTFVALELTGDIEMIQSQSTLRFYATVRKCNVASTLDLQTAQACIGKQLPGRIAKVPCAEYEYTIEETGEVITLSHHREYLPEGEPTPLRMVSNNMAA